MIATILPIVKMELENQFTHLHRMICGEVNLQSYKRRHNQRDIQVRWDKV